MSALAAKLKTAMAAARRVEIVKGKFPGDKLLFVDGKLWAELPMTSHGPRGTSYDFRQLTGVPSPRFRLVTVDGGRGAHPIRLRSQNRQDPRPIAVRLQETAERLVRDGLLIDPEEIAAGYRKEAEERQRKATLRLQRERQEWHARASDCIAGLKLTATETAAVVDKILAAMTWAQQR